MKDDQLMSMYLQLRDRRTQRKKAFEADDESDKAYQEKIEQMFLAKFNEEGSDTISCRGIGTAYKTTKTSVTVADKDAFLREVREKELWQLLDVRALKSAVDEFTEATETLPPGLNISRVVSVNIRRS